MKLRIPALDTCINEKTAELKSEIARIKTDPTIAKTTRSTKLYAKQKERRILLLINCLLAKLSAATNAEEIELDEDNYDTLQLLTTLASERLAATAIDIEEGDSILELMQTYADRKNLLQKLEKAAAAKNLYLDFKTGVVAAK